MAFESDDLEPLKKKSQPRNLDPMSVEELREYIAILKAEQIAGLAVFLASDTASNMQGTALVSDGGWTAQ